MSHLLNVKILQNLKQPHWFLEESPICHTLFFMYMTKGSKFLARPVILTRFGTKAEVEIRIMSCVIIYTITRKMIT